MNTATKKAPNNAVCEPVGSFAEVEWLRSELARERGRREQYCAAIGYLEAKSGCLIGDIDEWYKIHRMAVDRLLHGWKVVRGSVPDLNSSDTTARQKAMKLVVR